MAQLYPRLRGIALLLLWALLSEQKALVRLGLARLPEVRIQQDRQPAPLAPVELVLRRYHKVDLNPLLLLSLVQLLDHQAPLDRHLLN